MPLSSTSKHQEWISGWGQTHPVHATIITPKSNDEIQALAPTLQQWIPRGMGKSYGDASVGHAVIDSHYLNQVINFNQVNGIITCNAGISLEDIHKISIPSGWFLPVVPGTQLISIGGAIAADIHGKNHHQSGSFSDHIHSLTMMTGEGEIITCSTEKDSDIFYATCGGMGLTGIILSATIQLLAIETSWITQSVTQTKNLEETLTYFDENSNVPYSVAWLDSLADQASLGRGIIFAGDHSKKSELAAGTPSLILDTPAPITVPCHAPNGLINPITMSIFNTFYYHQFSFKPAHGIVSYRPFFFPLDSVGHWNRLYGHRGFLQYQCVVPLPSGHDSIKEILEAILKAKTGSFLAVLKRLGAGNPLKPLSFPMEGYTLALDFCHTPKVLALLTHLDEIVERKGGRIYLAKDARMSTSTLKSGYPDLDKLITIKRRLDPHNKIQSQLSKRLNIT